MKDVLGTLERWTAEGRRFATATVVKTERSAPRGPGAVLAVSEQGGVAGSVTGGCVEPAVYDEAQAVLAGGPPRLVSYGIADEEAFEVGLPCGGTVHIFLAMPERGPVDERTAICVLTQDHKFDVPLLKVALETPAVYIGAMGARRTTESRNERLLAEGVTKEPLARIHAPIGLRIGSRTPEEVAVAVAAEIVATRRQAAMPA